MTCLYMTTSSINRRVQQQKHHKDSTKQAFEQQKSKNQRAAAIHVAMPQPSTYLPMYDDSVVSLLLALALAFRLAADLIVSLVARRSPSTSLDGAARLAKLEAAVSQQSKSLETSQRAVDKARLRYELYCSAIKQPVRAIEASQVEQAQVLTMVATDIASIKEQARGHEQVLLMQQELVGRLVDLVRRKGRDPAGTVPPSSGTAPFSSLLAEPATTPPDPWTFRGDPG